MQSNAQKWGGLRMGLTISAITVLMIGCATTYGPSGFGGGYSETQLAENAFRVTFRGNGYTSPERAADFCLLRCAELALVKGFKYFVIVDAIEYSKTGTFKTPETSTTTGSATKLGDVVIGKTKTRTYGGQTYRVSKPRATNTILCSVERPDSDGLVFEATFLISSLKSKYGVGD